MSYDAFNILMVDEEQKALRHRFSIRYDQRVNIDNVPLGKGIVDTADRGAPFASTIPASTSVTSLPIRTFAPRSPCP